LNGGAPACRWGGSRAAWLIDDVAAVDSDLDLGWSDARQVVGAPLERDGPPIAVERGGTMTDPIQPWPVVAPGAVDHPVRTLQHLLRAQGQTVVVDGIFGPKTAGAVRTVQQQHHLTVDGIVGPQTWPALIVQVARGSTGDAVRGVQEEFRFRTLSDEPGAGLRVDGTFGALTEAAVRGFQEALGTTVDGIVGPLTWRALVSGMLSL
jgi:peptidoglycan hydrolase-like protein with peptidoglycan-binding domain